MHKIWLGENILSYNLRIRVLPQIGLKQEIGALKLGYFRTFGKIGQNNIFQNSNRDSFLLLTRLELQNTKKTILTKNGTLVLPCLSTYVLVDKI